MNKPSTTPQNSDTETSWLLLEGTTEDGPIVVRVVEKWKNKKYYPDHQYQIGVAVPLLDETNDGLPGPDEMVRLDAIEDSLCEALEKDSAIIAAVISTSGMREFVFYVDNWIPEHYETVVMKVQDQYSDYDLQFMMQEDPERETIRSLLP